MLQVPMTEIPYSGTFQINLKDKNFSLERKKCGKRWKVKRMGKEQKAIFKALVQDFEVEGM